MIDTGSYKVLNHEGQRGYRGLAYRSSKRPSVVESTLGRHSDQRRATPNIPCFRAAPRSLREVRCLLGIRLEELTRRGVSIATKQAREHLAAVLRSPVRNPDKLVNSSCGGCHYQRPLRVERGESIELQARHWVSFGESENGLKIPLLRLEEVFLSVQDGLVDCPVPRPNEHFTCRSRM